MNRFMFNALSNMNDEGIDEEKGEQINEQINEEKDQSHTCSICLNRFEPSSLCAIVCHSHTKRSRITNHSNIHHVLHANCMAKLCQNKHEVACPVCRKTSSCILIFPYEYSEEKHGCEDIDKMKCRELYDKYTLAQSIQEVERKQLDERKDNDIESGNQNVQNVQNVRDVRDVRVDIGLEGSEGLYQHFSLPVFTFIQMTFFIIWTLFTDLSLISMQFFDNNNSEIYILLVSILVYMTICVFLDFEHIQRLQTYIQTFIVITNILCIFQMVFSLTILTISSIMHLLKTDDLYSYCWTCMLSTFVARVNYEMINKLYNRVLNRYRDILILVRVLTCIALSCSFLDVLVNV